ncbi:MAG TPA: aminotransferase class I/II-fold pyridoxal phosphate-dependent enzyme [Gemmatimonadaceae bacterium]|nr:aminotransferase class I/II-fold pyridoxal phosphate-dependent enzyme [Gemmatimonadaceae bacterium]
MRRRRGDRLEHRRVPPRSALSAASSPQRAGLAVASHRRSGGRWRCGARLGSATAGATAVRRGWGHRSRVDANRDDPAECAAAGPRTASRPSHVAAGRRGRDLGPGPGTAVDGSSPWRPQPEPKVDEGLQPLGSSIGADAKLRPLTKVNSGPNALNRPGRLPSQRPANLDESRRAGPYRNLDYGPDAILAGAKPVFVPLERPEWRLDPALLRAAFTDRTKAIVVNTPHNPSGRVLTRDEMTLIADLCREHDAWAITDEIYEHIRYAGDHHAIATWPGMRERTVTISGLSKTFSCTGWRLGYAIAPEAQTAAIRKVHDFLTVGAPAPLQAAGAVGMAFAADYYNHMALDYRRRRDLLVAALDEAGFAFSVPQGAYYVLADFSALSDHVDVEFAKWMTREIGVATVPGSSFYHERERGRSLVRFAFCKRLETLERAAERLATLQAKV